MNMKVLITLICCCVTTFFSNARSNVNDFLIKNQMVHELAQNKSFMQCINQELKNTNIGSKHAIILRQVSAGSDLGIVQSLSSSLIQSFIEVRRGVADKIHLYDAAEFSASGQEKYDSVREIRTTLTGFESGGELPGEGLELHSKYISFGGGVDFEHSLISVDFLTSTNEGRILDGFSLATVIDSIDRSKDAAIGGSSFSVMFSRESYNNPSRVLAEKVLLTHAAVKLLESILNIKFDCKYEARGQSVRSTKKHLNSFKPADSSSMEVIEITASMPKRFKSKMSYFPKSYGRAFKCRRLKCNIVFKGRVNDEIAAYVEDAMVEAFPFENNVDINCDIASGKLSCLARGNIQGFNKQKMKRYLYGR